MSHPASSSVFDHVQPPTDFGSRVGKAEKKAKSKKSEKKDTKRTKKTHKSGGSNGSSHRVDRSVSSSSGRKRTKSHKDGKAKRKALNWLELEDWDARNVTCQICGCKDSDCDEVFGKMKMIWGYPPILVVGTGRYTTSGRACFYCARVQMSAYYPAIRIKDMKARMGEDPNLHKDS